MTTGPSPRRVTFVVPVKNDAVSLNRCLTSIRANDYPQERVTVVVADNGSSDSSAAVARSHGALVLNLPEDGLGSLRNQGARAVESDIVAFADADHEICRDWISRAVSALAAPDVAAVGSPYRSPLPGTWVQRAYDAPHRRATSTQRTEWLGSGNLAVKREAFDAVGGFDTSLRTCEDVDLCRRFRARGWLIMNVPALQSVHYGNPATLKQIFFGESWRGRDNLRVSLRPPRTWKSLSSAAASVIFLSATLVTVVGALSMTRTGLAWSLGGVGLVAAGLAGRTAMMLRAGFPLRDWPGVFGIAAAYEFGRAVALIGRVDYRRRRPATTA